MVEMLESVTPYDKIGKNKEKNENEICHTEIR